MKYLKSRNQSLLLVLFFFFNAFLIFSCASNSFSEVSSKITPDFIDHLESETYENIMKRFNLKKYFFIRNLNLSDIVEKRTLANIIAKNFIEANYYGWNKFFDRYISSDDVIKADRFNKEILYELMTESKTFISLGYKLCFLIIDIIFKEFTPRVTFSTTEHIIFFQSISLQISDFLEFILNNLVPNQNISLKDFSASSCLHDQLYIVIVEQESFEVLNRTVTMAEISKFRDVEILEIILKRYSKSMAPNFTQNYISDAKVYLSSKPLIFRQILTLLVKMTPEYFLASQFMTQYTRIFLEFVNITIHLANMAPIFRALMMLDSQEDQDNYLETYYNRISRPATICFKSLDTFSALNILIMDSNFSFSGSLEISDKKSKLLSKILSQYYGISCCDYFDLAKKCIVNGYMPLYEVLLQHFADVFSHEKRIELLLFIVTESLIKNKNMAIVISLSYLDFDNRTEMLEKLDPETNFVNTIPGIPTSKLSKVEQIKIFQIIRELTIFLIDCPIKCSISISIDENFLPIAWPCPESLLRLETPESNFACLFMYALIILAKKFKIPIYGVSLFHSINEESVVWSETIGFINFMIDRMGALIGLDREKLFKFMDSTEYEC